MNCKNYTSPSDFKGSDTFRIQEAVNAAAASNGIVRIFPKEDRTPYMLESAILLPSHTTVFLENCHIKLADSCRDNIFRSANCYLNCGTVLPAEDIHIIGIGNPVLEGADRPRSTGDSGKVLGEITYGSDAGKEGVPQKGGWQNIGVLLVYVKNFTLENFTVKEPHCWSISLEYCSFGKVKNIHFDSVDNRIIDGKEWRILNQDGLDLRRGCHDIVIDSISFEFGLNAWQDTVANPLIAGAVVKSGGNIVSTLEKMEKSVDAKIKALRKTVEESQ